MTRKTGILLFLLTLCLSGCMDQSDEPKPTGTLTGTVTIGPLCAVEPCELTNEDIYAAYAARKILIYDVDSTTVLLNVSINKDSTYLVNLSEGKYVVDIDRSGIDQSAEVPAAITIIPRDTVTLDINIDTGIR
jgi:hypothetical protein